MRRQIVRPASNDTTRDRILKAAMLRFSTQSYEETGLREIAADVGIDMAYVHRSFGSKEKLFYETVKAACRPDFISTESAEEQAAALAQGILLDKGENEIRPFDILVHSFSSPGAASVLRKVLADNFIAPLLDQHPALTEQRAALLAAVLTGISVMREVIQAEPLQRDKDGEVEDLITRLIAGLLEPDDVVSGGQRATRASEPCYHDCD